MDGAIEEFSLLPPTIGGEQERHFALGQLPEMRKKRGTESLIKYARRVTRCPALSHKDGTVQRRELIWAARIETKCPVVVRENKCGQQPRKQQPNDSRNGPQNVYCNIGHSVGSKQVETKRRDR